MKMWDYRPEPGQLEGRAVLVTGASAGLGRAAATALAEYGAEPILLGRNTEKLRETAEIITGRGGGTPLITPFDLATAGEGDYVELGERIFARHGRLDGLLHNAALLGEMRPIAQADAETWHRVMQVNVNAAFLLSREMLPFLERSPEASIVFTSSGVARAGLAYWGAYCVSKFATRGLMQTLAAELENTSAIRVNSLDPGIVDTAMRRSAFPGEDPAANPAPEALAGCYLYLLGPAGKGENGCEFHREDEIGER